jgi:PII-like signaling protein
MQGYTVTFITEEGKRHKGKPVSRWLLDVARSLGIQGVTTVAGVEGMGRHGKLHSARFIELADQPLELMMAVSAEQCEQLFQLLEQEEADLFYVKTPVEYGVVGAPKPR